MRLRSRPRPLPRDIACFIRSTISSSPFYGFVEWLYTEGVFQPDCCRKCANVCVRDMANLFCESTFNEECFSVIRMIRLESSDSGSHSAVP